MYFNKTGPNKGKHNSPIYFKGTIYLISVLSLFIIIGLMTTIKPAYRFSSHLITEWTSDIDSSTFLYILGNENRAFRQAYPQDETVPKLSTVLFQVATNLKPNDPRSLLGHELPGFSSFGNQIIIAGEGTNHSNLSIESSPPLEEVMKEREAVMDESPKKEEEEEVEEDTNDQNTGEDDVVFLYNTHNRESFLPHLPDVTDPNSAHHRTVNITKVSERFAEALEAKGIGTSVDETDHMNVLNEKGWGYEKSYDASRSTVSEAVSTNEKLDYIFDLHRDSLPRKDTTIEIDGKDYAKILMVVGADYDRYEENLSVATEFHYLIEEKYPVLSKGVIKKAGAGTNGVFNQDLLKNSMLLEVGGYENSLEEMYRSVDALAAVFSELYWEAEEVDAKEKEE